MADEANQSILKVYAEKRDLHDGVENNSELKMFYRNIL